MSSATLNEYINNTKSVVTADGRQIVIDDLVDLYREFAKTPVPIAGHLYRCGHNKRRMSLRTDWRVRDMDRPEATKHAVHHTIKLSKDCTRVKHIQPVGQPVDVTNELAATARAPVSQYMAVVRKGSKDPESPFSFVTELHTLVCSFQRSIDTDSVDEHSALVLDDTFGRLLWSANGKQLLYVAEYKAPKAQSYYKRVNKKTDKPDKEPDTRGQEFVHRDDWGHFLEGISHTVICILDVSKDFKIRTIEMTPINANPDLTGYAVLRHKCLDLRSEDSVPQLVCGSERTAIRSPRPLPDGTGFVYLECEVGGPHYKASRDYAMWKLSFRFIPLQTREILRLYLIDLKTRHLIPIDFPLPSVQLLDFRDNLVIAVGSAINVKPNVFVGRLDDNIPEPSIEWLQIETNSNDSLKDISVEKIT
ncbi:unnamed protein product [Oppiella nova]|uniref:Acylamino-acid-releasing enzyme N-terminal domain-containing protein n=1 Tax=Oppiella nova TaxID=334625 RepID=A0A7R9LNP3_9ACAR|nr:unnamed protein product [Oppiella nova]CAG2165445.1 unnamed protein product [Oppiella nova]